ncbi:MAG: protein TolR [Gammaproteobacteria bacterium]|nr:protein TolR [Gammaproteobacteria bacterium]
MNVVPYIDVMLVLLIIFMVTAPLITQGVKVDLPQVASEVLPPQQHEPLIISVDRQGRYYVEFGDAPDTAVDAQTLVNKVVAALRYAPQLPVIVRGDREAAYGQVVGLMALLQSAGIQGVGLMTEPPAN